MFKGNQAFLSSDLRNQVQNMIQMQHQLKKELSMKSKEISPVINTVAYY